MTSCHYWHDSYLSYPLDFNTQNLLIVAIHDWLVSLQAVALSTNYAVLIAVNI